MNYYELLGVSKSASEQQIKKSYKKLALKHHPDKNLSKKQEAKQKFTKISQAYAVLSDPVKRRQYDNSLLNKNVSVFIIENFGAEQTKWKNPEFDPSYNHFQNGSRNQGPRVSNMNFNSLDKFDMRFSFPLFKKDFMNVPFGEFTFQMAEQIFNQVFNQIEKKYPMKSLANKEAYYYPETMTKCYSDSYSYKPKDSSLISEKTIQRKGKRVLVKKYSITQNGYTRTETHEQIIH